MYVSLDEVKIALGLYLDDPADDVALQLAIDAASAMVDEHCGRRFDQVVGERLFTLESGKVYVDDVADGLVVAVDLDGDGVHERVLTATEFRALPLNAAASDQPVTSLVDLAVQPSGTQTRGAIKVTATFGWPVVPSVVRHAAFALALRLYRRVSGPFGVAGSPALGEQAQAWADADVEAQLRHLVLRYPLAA